MTPEMLDRMQREHERLYTAFCNIAREISELASRVEEYRLRLSREHYPTGACHESDRADSDPKG
jgi:hypothetical protein